MTHAFSTPALANSQHHAREAPAANPASPRRIYNPIQQDAITFVQTAEETNGEYTLLEMEIAAGGGTILHYHTTFTEHFTVISGEVGVQVGKDTFVLQPGQSGVAPVRSIHRWYNPSQARVVVRVELRPGHTGFERSLRISYGLARDGLTTRQSLPKNLVHLALLFDLADTNLPGLFSAIAPLLRLLARWARRKGIERELVERYCQ